MSNWFLTERFLFVNMIKWRVVGLKTFAFSSWAAKKTTEMVDDRIVVRREFQRRFFPRRSICSWKCRAVEWRHVPQKTWDEFPWVEKFFCKPVLKSKRCTPGCTTFSKFRGLIWIFIGRCHSILRRIRCTAFAENRRHYIFEDNRVHSILGRARFTSFLRRTGSPTSGGCLMCTVNTGTAAKLPSVGQLHFQTVYFGELSKIAS